jgi:hypothetical protein
LKELRKEGKEDRKKGEPQRGDRAGGKGKKGRKERGGRRDRKKGGKRDDAMPKDPEAKKEYLDKQMEQYWLKGGHKELGKSIFLKLTRTSLTLC